MTFIEGCDPGRATGIAWGTFTDTEPFRLVAAETLGPDTVRRRIIDWQNQSTDMVRVWESFRLRGSNKFTADLAGVELIGAAKLAQAMFITMPQIIWQSPTDKALVRDEILKSSGLWRTPSDVGWNTGRHANDAIIHILAMLKKSGHEPTIEYYWGKP